MTTENPDVVKRKRPSTGKGHAPAAALPTSGASTGPGVASGVYYCRLDVDGLVDVRKMVVLR